MLTKKYYESVAAIIKGERERCRELNRTGAYNGDLYDGAMRASEGIAEDLSDYFAADSPKFDRRRFLRACGVED